MRQGRTLELLLAWWAFDWPTHDFIGQFCDFDWPPTNQHVNQWDKHLATEFRGTQTHHITAAKLNQSD